MDLCVGFFLPLLSIAQCKLLSLSCQDIKAFVDGHNSRRLKVAKGQLRGQPAAKNMKLLMWDNELAAKAEKWAATYPETHNPDYHVDSDRFWTGENIFFLTTANGPFHLKIDDVVHTWFIEHNNYKYHPLKEEDFNGEEELCGHYTQVVWANTMYVGCAISKRQKHEWTEYFAVCNYGPAGNFIGSTPYESGGPQQNLICGDEDCSKPYSDKC